MGAELMYWYTAVSSTRGQLCQIVLQTQNCWVHSCYYIISRTYFPLLNALDSLIPWGKN